MSLSMIVKNLRNRFKSIALTSLGSTSDRISKVMPHINNIDFSGPLIDNIDVFAITYHFDNPTRIHIPQVSIFASCRVAVILLVYTLNSSISGTKFFHLCNSYIN